MSVLNVAVQREAGVDLQVLDDVPEPVAPEVHHAHARLAVLVVHNLETVAVDDVVICDKYRASQMILVWVWWTWIFFLVPLSSKLCPGWRDSGRSG